MRLNSPKESSFIRSIVDYKKKHEPQSVQKIQKKILNKSRNIAGNLANIARDDFEVIRMPFSAKLKNQATKRIEELLTAKTPDDPAYDRYVKTKEGLSLLSKESVEQDSDGNYIIPLQGNLFPENNSGLPLEISPDVKVMGSKAQWMKPLDLIVQFL